MSIKLTCQVYDDDKVIVSEEELMDIWDWLHNLNDSFPSHSSWGSIYRDNDKYIYVRFNDHRVSLYLTLEYVDSIVSGVRKVAKGEMLLCVKTPEGHYAPLDNAQVRFNVDGTKAVVLSDDMKTIIDIYDASDLVHILACPAYQGNV